jgi:hypothetical protein
MAPDRAAARQGSGSVFILNRATYHARRRRQMAGAKTFAQGKIVLFASGDALNSRSQL